MGALSPAGSWSFVDMRWPPKSLGRRLVSLWLYMTAFARTECAIRHSQRTPAASTPPRHCIAIPSEAVKKAGRSWAASRVSASSSDRVGLACIGHFDRILSATATVTDPDGNVLGLIQDR